METPVEVLDEKFVEAVELFLKEGRASTSLLQRRLGLGFTRAEKICQQMEQLSIVGPDRGAKGRELIADRERWEAIRVSWPTSQTSANVAVAEAKPGRFETLMLADVVPSENNTRTVFDEAKMAELRASLEASGQLTPINVKPIKDQPGKYEILDGERRWRALRDLGQLFIEAKIIEVDDAKTELLMRLIANAQREDISPLEEAEAFSKYLAMDKEHTKEELAKQIGLSVRHVYARLELLRLCPYVRRELLDGRITVGHAEIISRIKDSNEQCQIVDFTIDKELSVRGLAAWLKQSEPASESESTGLNGETSGTRQPAQAEDDASSDGEADDDDLTEEQRAAVQPEGPSDAEIRAQAERDLKEADKQLAAREKRMEVSDGPKPDAEQLSGEKLTAACKLETGVRRRILAAIGVGIAFTNAEIEEMLVTIALKELSVLRNDYNELANEIARAFKVEPENLDEHIRTQGVNGVARFLAMLDLVHYGVELNELELRLGRPEAWSKAAALCDLDIAEIEEAEKAAQAGVLAPKKAKAKSNSKQPAANSKKAKVKIKDAIAANKAKAKKITPKKAAKKKR